jgi:hypothetical protein
MTDDYGKRIKEDAIHLTGVLAEEFGHLGWLQIAATIGYFLTGLIATHCGNLETQLAFVKTFYETMVGALKDADENQIIAKTRAYRHDKGGTA